MNEKNCPFKFSSFLGPKPTDSNILQAKTEIVQYTITCPCEKEKCLAWHGVCSLIPPVKKL